MNREGEQEWGSEDLWCLLTETVIIQFMSFWTAVLIGLKYKSITLTPHVFLLLFLLFTLI